MMVNLNVNNQKTETIYRITLIGEMEQGLEQWFEGMELEVREGKTILTGQLVDQSELHGVLRMIHDLHLNLESVELISE